MVCTKCIGDSIVTSASSQCPWCKDNVNFGATFNTASSRHDTCAYKEQLEALHLEQSNLNDLLNYSAIIVGDCSPLLSSLIKKMIDATMKIAD